MKRISLLLIFLVFVISCSKEEPTPPLPTKYNVSISLNPTDGGTVTPNGGQFNEGQTVSFTVTPSENFIFKNWSGSDTSSNNPLSLNINSSKTLTANFEKKDTDGDGVTDDVDQCPNTTSGEEVSETGCSSSQVDTDGDGVVDSIDQDNSTREGVPVDDNGVMLNPIYLDQNGITIKARDWGEVGDVGYVNNVEYRIVDRAELVKWINEEPDFEVCVSKISNMRSLFDNNRTFNKSIDYWDVSNTNDMSFMFKYSVFNKDISNWDVSNVTDMTSMFELSIFTKDVEKWNVSSVQYMTAMFKSHFSISL